MKLIETLLSHTQKNSLIMLVITLSACGGGGGSDFVEDPVTLGAALDQETTELTTWLPDGARFASVQEQTNPIISEGDRFTTIHGGFVVQMKSILLSLLFLQRLLQ